MTYQEFADKLKEHYGDAGIFALETSCVTSAAIADMSFDEALELILPALEEELMNEGDA